MNFTSYLLSFTLALSITFGLNSCSSSTDKQESTEISCCHKDCSPECKKVCMENKHACSIDSNDKSCCVAEDGSKLEECCNGKMPEGKACCKKS